ncbi:MAG: hypothetical protein ACLVKO_03385 [Dysgonomonas sp.]
MKKVLLCLLTFVSSVAMAQVPPPPVANIYASGLKGELQGDGTYKVNFFLNTEPTSVEFQVLNGEEIVKTIPINFFYLGENTLIVNPADIPVGTYTWQIKATAENFTEPVKFSDENLSQMQFFGPRGVAVDNNPKNPNFGRIYVSETQAGTVTDRTTNNGIYILDPLFNDVTGQGATAYAGGETWSSTSSPYRICVAPDGRLFMSDWSDNHSGIYIMDTSNPSANFTQIFGGTRDANGLFAKDGVNIGGSTPHCWVLGEGENTKLYVFDEDYLNTENGVTKGNNLLQYNIGTKTLWEEAPSAIAYNDAANGSVQLNGNTSIAPDGRGGWWISQYRATDAASVPSLIHVNTEGNIDFNSGNTPSLLGASFTGGMAVSPDFKKLAIGTARKTLQILEINFDDAGIPSLTPLYTIATLGDYTAGLAFDVAENVYLVSNSNERLSAWAIPKAENSFTTPARAEFTFTGTLKTANIYASGLTGEEQADGTYKVTYVLNTKATAVEFQAVKDGEIVKSYTLTSLEKGSNTATIDISDLGGGGDYTWQIKATAESVTDITKITNDSQPELQFWGPRGLAVDNSFDSPYFGRIYVSDINGGPVSNRTTTVGIYILDPLFTDITGQGETGYAGGIAWPANSGPHRLSVAPDGRVLPATIQLQTQAYILWILLILLQHSRLFSEEHAMLPQD